MADDNFEDGLAALRREFAERLPERARELTAAKAGLDAAGTEAQRHDALTALEETAHKLAGSGGLFGFPEIGAVAQELEKACQDARDTSAWPPAGPAVERNLARLLDLADNPA